MLVGLGLVMAGACVANNLLDRRIDAAMERTKRRALPAGKVSVRVAGAYSALLTLAGLIILGLGTTPMATLWAAGGWLAYVALYGYAKRHTVHGTLVGSLSGAVPPVVGYTAVTGRLDATAWLLFLIMAVWQMPHFYAIAIFRLNDYRAAGLPIISVVKGVRATQEQIVAYILLFTAVALLLPLLGAVSWIYTFGMIFLCGLWLLQAIRGQHDTDPNLWARRLFGWSLWVLLGWSALIAVY